MPSEACAEELETVLAIFLDDIQVVEQDTDTVLVTMVLYPSTGDDSESKYVTLTLELLLPPQYPDESPKITFRNPRGLSDEMLNTLIVQMKTKCEEILGCSMIFELIDMGKEFLTTNNRPASECPICLLSFTEFDVFFRPSCFHHVHSFCLGKYLFSVHQSWNNEDHLPNESLVKNCCPVCRNEFIEDIDIQKFLSAPPPSEENEEALLKPCVPEDWLGKRETLNRLFAKQKSQGGIIDLTSKDKKLLVISSPTSDTNGSLTSSGSSSVVGGSVLEGNSSLSMMSESLSSSGGVAPVAGSTGPSSHTTGHSRPSSRPQHHHHQQQHHRHQHQQPSRHNQNHNYQNHNHQHEAGHPIAGAPTTTTHPGSESKTHSHTKDSNSCPHYRHRRRK